MRVVVATLVASLAAAAAADAAPSPVLVTLHRSGGFVALDRGLRVLRSGKVESDGLALTRAALTRAQLATLRLRLAQARFGTLKKEYAAKQPVADGYVYRITYGGRTVVVDQGAVPPTRLRRVLDLLLRLAHP
jgi:hypothetical protein